MVNKRSNHRNPFSKKKQNSNPNNKGSRLMCLAGQDIHDLNEVHADPSVVDTRSSFFMKFRPSVKLVLTTETKKAARNINRARKKGVGVIAKGGLAKRNNLKIISGLI